MNQTVANRPPVRDWVSINVRTPPDVARILRTKSQATGTSVGNLGFQLIESALNEEGGVTEELRKLREEFTILRNYVALMDSALRASIMSSQAATSVWRRNTAFREDMDKALEEANAQGRVPEA